MSDQFSSNSPCNDCGHCDNCCEEIIKEEATIQVIRTCASTDPADTLTPNPTEENPREEITYDCITAASLVSAVGATFTILVKNNLIYKVGQWIEFFGLTGYGYAAYQITAISSGNNFEMTLTNGVYDSTIPGYVEVKNNPPQNYSLGGGSCFSVVDVIRQETLSEATQQVLEILNAADGIQFNNTQTLAEDCTRMRILGLPYTTGCNPATVIADEILAKTTSDQPTISAETIFIPVPDPAASIDVVTNKHYMAALNGSTGAVTYLDILEGLENNTAYNLVTSTTGVLSLSKSQEVQSWRLKNQVELTTPALDTDASYYRQEMFITPATAEGLAVSKSLSGINIPPGATHASIMISTATDDKPIYLKVADSSGRIVFEVSCGRSGNDYGFQASSVAIAKINFDDPNDPLIDLNFITETLNSGDPVAALSGIATIIRLNGFTTVNEIE